MKTELGTRIVGDLNVSFLMRKDGQRAFERKRGDGSEVLPGF